MSPSFGGGISETLYQVIQIANHFVEQLVHQLWLHHLGDVSYDAFAGAGNPSGLGVGTAAAGEDEDAGIGLLKGLQIGGELAFGEGVGQAIGILLERPVGGVFVYVGPVEAGAAVGRVAEVVDIVAFLAEALDHFGVIGISPAGCDVNHNG